MLNAMLAQKQIECVTVMSVADDPVRARAQLATTAERCDIILTTGGVSAGDRDFVKPAFNALHGDMVFSGVAMKPGKPVSFGKIGRAYWLGLPGNPMAACVAWLVFGRALVARLSGCINGPPGRQVVLAENVRVAPGRVEHRPARLDGHDPLGRQIVIAAKSTNSAKVAQMAFSDGFVRLVADHRSIPQGSLVEFIPFEEG
jgi:molybdopterin molybdotransferase